MEKTHLNTKDFLSLIISAIALGVSLITFWKIQASPYKLIVTSPTISHLSSERPDLSLDISLYNLGATPAVIEAVHIEALDNDETAQFWLHASQVKDATGGDTTDFVALIIPPKQPRRIRLMMHQGSPGDIENADILSVSHLQLAFKVNGIWHRNLFKLKYAGYIIKFGEDGSIRS